MENNIADQSREARMYKDKSLFGGVIYIDLRNYTRVVEEKPLKNIARIVYEYQEAITQKIKKSFLDKEVLAFEYMGDGVLVIFKDINVDSLEYPNSIFALKVYNNAKVLKDIIRDLLSEKKEKYDNLQDLDFGMGLSCSVIYQQSYYGDNNTSGREIFFGTSLNRAAKIGDSMNRDKGNIGIDKKMYYEFLAESLSDNEKKCMIEEKSPIVHMHQKCKEKLL